MISCSNCPKQYPIGSKKSVNEFVNKTSQKYALDDPRAYNDYCRDCNKDYRQTRWGYNEQDIDEMQKFDRPNSYDKEFIADDDESEEVDETDESEDSDEESEEDDESESSEEIKPVKKMSKRVIISDNEESYSEEDTESSEEIPDFDDLKNIPTRDLLAMIGKVDSLPSKIHYVEKDLFYRLFDSNDYTYDKKRKVFTLNIQPSHIIGKKEN
jgi:hypothetical protein